MNIYFLFSTVKDEYICKYIYTNESKKVFSYSYDEGYIVKNEESMLKDLSDVEAKFAAKSKGKKAPKKSSGPILIQKEFPDVRQSLFFLNGSLDNFNNGVPSRKRLPEIISPYDMDFESTDDFDDLGERGFEETEGDFDKSKVNFVDDPMEDDDIFDDSIDDDDDFDSRDAYKDDYDLGHDDFDDDDDDDDRYRK
jgi:hypothetical protein